MKFILTIITCLLLTSLYAQKQRLIANGRFDHLYIKHKVSSKETFQTVGARYNVSPQTIANYNNLEYYKGRLFAKYLKVPLNTQNFVKVDDVITPLGLIPVYKKMSNGKMSVIGYLQKVPEQGKGVKPIPTFARIIKDSIPAIKQGVENLDSLAANMPPQSFDTISKAVTPAPVVLKKTHEISPEFKINRSRSNPSRNPSRNTFSPKDYITEFLSTAITLILVTFSLIGVIYFYLSVKKKRFFFRMQLKVHVVKLISNAILCDDEDEGNDHLTFTLPRILAKQIHKKEVRQLVIDELIVAKKSLRGKAALNLVYLYEQLGLLDESLDKLYSEKWFIKAKGIQELAMMDQSKMSLPIFKQTNSKNEFVRMEAQSAIVHFGGFKGLRFLHVLIYPLSDWQQMKLIEQLSLLSEKELPNANKLLLSKNDSVVIFTLKIISVFHNLALHNEVSACLYHENEIIRYHAIKCLQYIFDDTTAGILQDVYQNQGVKNKMAILDVLKVIGGSEQTEFLYLELFDEDDNIKLTAASALMACCEDALDLIEDVSSQKGFPYTNILHHVKEGLLV